MTSAGEGSFGSLVDFINQKGVVLTNDYLVQAQASPDMTVKATPGTAYLPSIASVPPSINATVYSTILDANSNVTIAANASGVAKIDAVVLYIDTAASADATASNVAKLTSVRGTASASPTDGEIQTAVGASNPFLRLADVAVANGASSINSGNITDKRAYCDPLIRRAVIDGTMLTPSAITLGYVEDTSGQSGITTQTDLTQLTVTVTVPTGGRRVTITGQVLMSNNTAGQAGILFIMEGATQLALSRSAITLSGVGYQFRAERKLVASTGSHTYKLQFAADGGTASTSWAADRPNSISVEVR